MTSRSSGAFGTRRKPSGARNAGTTTALSADARVSTRRITLAKVDVRNRPGFLRVDVADPGSGRFSNSFVAESDDKTIVLYSYSLNSGRSLDDDSATILLRVPISCSRERLRATYFFGTDWKNWPSGAHRAIWKGLKRLQVEAMKKDWEQVLPIPIAAWATRRLQDKAEEVRADYVDSFRVARVDSPSQKRRFAKYRSCCGSHEWKETGPDGKVYLFGFNYGH